MQYDAGARVLTDCWGANSQLNYDSYSVGFDTFLWSHPDVLSLTAAGNQGKAGQKPFCYGVGVGVRHLEGSFRQACRVAYAQHPVIVGNAFSAYALG